MKKVIDYLYRSFVLVLFLAIINFALQFVIALALGYSFWLFILRALVIPAVIMVCYALFVVSIDTIYKWYQEWKNNG